MFQRCSHSIDCRVCLLLVDTETVLCIVCVFALIVYSIQFSEIGTGLALICIHTIKGESLCQKS